MSKGVKGLLIFLAVLILIILIPFFYLKGTYNTLVTMDEAVKASWAQVENQLQRRYDLIPNLIETVKGYMGHERELLTEVTELRAKSMSAREVDEKGRAERLLSRSLANVFAVAEGYPDLKANQNFLELQKQLSEIEEQLQLARRYYNGTVRNLNIKVESFPSSIVAAMFNFIQASYFEIEEDTDRAVPKVKF